MGDWVVGAAVRGSAVVGFVGCRHLELVQLAGFWFVGFWVVGFGFEGGGVMRAESVGRTAPGLRAWARGGYAAEAAVELLIRGLDGRLVSRDRPWVRSNPEARWYWLDPGAIASEAGGLSGGERRLLAVAGALLDGLPLPDLGATLAALDRDNLALVLAAMAHAGGSHEHVERRLTAEGPVYERLGPLVDWPARGDRLMGMAG